MVGQLVLVQLMPCYTTLLAKKHTSSNPFNDEEYAVKTWVDVGCCKEVRAHASKEQSMQTTTEYAYASVFNTQCRKQPYALLL